MVGGALFAGSAEAAGPWRGVVIDAETRQPLEGVIVLMHWVKLTATPGGWAGGKLTGVEEVVTDTGGRFTVPSHSTFTLLPFLWKITTELLMFKPGYGQWRFAGAEARAGLRADLESAELRRLWTAFEKDPDGVTFELPPLRTRQERLTFLSLGASPDRLIPPASIPRLEQALESERQYLGLGK